MRAIRKALDRLEPLFSRGGRFEQFGALFEGLDWRKVRAVNVRRPHLVE